MADIRDIVMADCRVTERYISSEVDILQDVAHHSDHRAEFEGFCEMNAETSEL